LLTPDYIKTGDMYLMKWAFTGNFNASHHSITGKLTLKAPGSECRSCYFSSKKNMNNYILILVKLKKNKTDAERNFN
jgi:hypothetical protein